MYGRGGVHDDRVLHRAVLLQRLHQAGDRGRLLADGDVDADHVLALLVDDGINRNGRLAGLAVADDQLALTAADGDHRVDGQDAGLHRLLDGLALDDAGSLELHRAHAFGLDGALAVDRHAERVHHAAEHLFARGDLHDTTGGLHLVVFLDCGDVTKQHGADFVLFEVLGHTVDGLAVGTHELEELARHGVLEAVDARDTVADLDDGSDFARFDARIERIELLAQCLVNRLCGDFSH